MQESGIVEVILLDIHLNSLGPMARIQNIESFLLFSLLNSFQGTPLTQLKCLMVGNMYCFLE